MVARDRGVTGDRLMNWIWYLILVLAIFTVAFELFACLGSPSEDPSRWRR